MIIREVSRADASIRNVSNDGRASPGSKGGFIDPEERKTVSHPYDIIPTRSIDAL